MAVGRLLAAVVGALLLTTAVLAAPDFYDRATKIGGMIAYWLDASNNALPVTAANPLPVHVVTDAGSVGADLSANKPTLPNIGANFAASGPYASYVLIATVAASTSRILVDVENTSGAQVAIVLDDGTAANGSVPVNSTVFTLSGGSGAGSQGGSWASQIERGRVQIYAPSSGAQVAVRSN